MEVEAMRAFEGACRRKHRFTRAVALGLAALLAAAPGTGLMAQEIDLTQTLGPWEDRPEYSLSLRESLGLAMDNNLDIAVQSFDRDITDTGVDRAKSAYDSTLTSTAGKTSTTSQNANPFAGTAGDNFRESTYLRSQWDDPTIWGGNVSVVFQSARSTYSPGLSILDPNYGSSLNMTYRQSLLRSFGLEINRAPINIARNNTRISDSQFRDLVMTTMEATESAYWELVFARRDLEVKRGSYSLANELLRINRAKVEVGTLAPIDVTQAEAGVASRAEDLIISVGNLLTAEDSLRKLLNPPMDHPIWTSTLVPSDTPAFTLDDEDAAAAFEVAKENRPELEQQQITIQNNALQEKIDRKAKQWDLYVQGTYATEGLEGLAREFVRDPVTGSITGTIARPDIQDTSLWDSVDELSDHDFADWALEVGLTIPIGNRAAKAQYMGSRLRHEQSQVQFDNLLLAARIDVTQKVRDVKVNRQRVWAAEKNRELQEKNLDAERKKYDNGMSTSFQVLEIQEDLSMAESQENRARVDFQKSLTALEKAKGTLLDARNIQVADTSVGPARDPFGGARISSMGSGR
jgi:outer membrane protein TolC